MGFAYGRMIATASPPATISICQAVGLCERHPSTMSYAAVGTMRAIMVVVAKPTVLQFLFYVLVTARGLQPGHAS